VVASAGDRSAAARESVGVERGEGGGATLACGGDKLGRQQPEQQAAAASSRTGERNGRGQAREIIVRKRERRVRYTSCAGLDCTPTCLTRSGACMGSSATTPID
jgi:hypothetical protein